MKSDTSLGGPKLRNGLLAPVKSFGGLIKKSNVPRLEVSESECSPLRSLNLPLFRRTCGFRGKSFLTTLRPFLISRLLYVFTDPLGPVAHLPQPLGKYLLGRGGAHIFLKPQKEFFLPVSLPHLNRDLFADNNFEIYSDSILFALNNGLELLPCRYFSFFFMKGRIEVSRSWNFWFLEIMRLNITRWVESTNERSNRSMLSSSFPLHKVHTNSKNLKQEIVSFISSCILMSNY